MKKYINGQNTWKFDYKKIDNHKLETITQSKKALKEYKKYANKKLFKN